MARAISPLLIRWTRLSVSAGTAESQEVDFSLSVRGAIGIEKVVFRLQTAAVTAVQQVVEGLVTLDGAAVANDAVSTQALYEAREILDDTVAQAGHAVDALTSGAGVTEKVTEQSFKEPLITARNPGVAGLAIVSIGEVLVGIFYKFLILSDAELVLQISRRRR